MKAYATSVGERCTYFISKHYKFIENNKIDKDTFLCLIDTEQCSLINISNNLDPLTYHREECGEEAFTQKEYTQIHTYDPSEQDDEEEDIW